MRPPVTLSLSKGAFAALLVVASLAPSGAVRGAETGCGGTLTAAQVAAIAKVADGARAAQHIAGMTIGVGRNGTLLFACGYGERDRERGLRADGATVYPLGSITKQFTAAAVMTLAAAGKVDIDAHVAKYVPETPHGDELTVRELLDQTSGLPDYTHSIDEKKWSAAKLGLAPAEYLRWIDGKPLAFAPGTKFEYSNTNYMVLGMLVERVAGQPFPAYLREHVLTPPGLTATTYLTTYRSAPGSDATRGYAYEKAHGFKLLDDFSMAWANTAGALAAPVADVIRWDGAFFGHRVVDAAAVTTMTTPPQLATPMFPPTVAKARPDIAALAHGYAFGWVVGEDRGKQLVWHNGGLPGARAMNLTVPSDGLEVVVLTNTSDVAPEKIAVAVARVLGD
ncbi:MAG: beta-lactamase family protein [Candidatus Eremiobacteraeota bacterium]|nr:beta-lactamase family protein [Candidatus Eremiobacteraeota bacterium]MBV9409325.1 beta-lactamase family protein [Candidatus Eremiobacteraeota bacterium]